MYTNICSATIDNELRNCQYKYILRELFQQIYHYSSTCIYKLKTTNLCDFCQITIETTRHLFWECRHAQQFWNTCNVSNLLSDIPLDTNINFEIISFGIYENIANIKTNIQHFIFMFAKYFIFE